MIFHHGNIWDLENSETWIIIPTNGEVNRKGHAIMGAGLAKQASTRFPELSTKLGFRLQDGGNRIYIFKDYRIITFPTKHSWRNPSDLSLIEKELHTLAHLIRNNRNFRFAIPKLGAGKGGLDFQKQVFPLLKNHFQYSKNVILVI